MHLSKRGLIILVVVGVAVAAAALFYLFGRDETAAVDVAEVKRDTITKVISGSGKVESRDIAFVSSPDPGVILEMRVQNGGFVKAGQVLALLGNADSQEEFIEAENELAEAETEAQKEDAEEELDDERDDGRNFEMIAPRSGQVFYERANVTPSTASKVISVGTYVSPGQVLFSVLPAGSLRFAAAVDEADIGLVNVGQTADVILDAYPDKTLQGKVARISETPTTTQSGGTAFEADIRLSGLSGVKLRQGLSGSADIEQSRKTDVLVVPFEAIQGSAGSPYVFLIEDGKIVRRDIKTALSTDTSVEVTSGLRRGDRVIISDPADLGPGQEVTIRSVRGT